MDAEDIFRKLSQGAKYSKKKLKTEQNKDFIKDAEVKPLQQIVEHKLEVERTLEDYLITDAEPLQLLGSIMDENTERKKRKQEGEGMQKQKRLKLEQEETSKFRHEMEISIQGENVPKLALTFNEFQIDEYLKENLIACGYQYPTRIQQQAVPVMLEGREILGCAPTGSGKTAAFLLPILQKLKKPKKEGFRAIVLCPTRELARQTYDEALQLSKGRNLKIFNFSKLKHISPKIGRNVTKLCDLLVTTPSRLAYLLNKDVNPLDLTHVEWIVIDEADRFFEETVRSFGEHMHDILMACTSVERKIAMFSATCTPEVAEWCDQNLRHYVRVTVGLGNTATDQVDQELIFTGDENGKLLAFRQMVVKGLVPPVLVFVNNKDRAGQLFRELLYDRIHVDAIHADRTQLQRDNTVRSFREGKIWVLICTELMSRGMDFKGVNLVVNYDFPESAIKYVHRIGRAGRAGRRGRAVTFFTLEDVPKVKRIVDVLKQSGCSLPDYLFQVPDAAAKLVKKFALKKRYKERDEDREMKDWLRKKEKNLGRNKRKNNKIKKKSKTKHLVEETQSSPNVHNDQLNEDKADTVPIKVKKDNNGQQNALIKRKSNKNSIKQTKSIKSNEKSTKHRKSKGKTDEKKKPKHLTSVPTNQISKKITKINESNNGTQISKLKFPK